MQLILVWKSAAVKLLAPIQQFLENLDLYIIPLSIKTLCYKYAHNQMNVYILPIIYYIYI